MERRIILTVGGEKIALKKFTREVILNTTMGLLKSLKTSSLDEKIVLTIEAPKQ